MITKPAPHIQVLLWVLAFLLALQFALGRVIPARWIYHYRVDFETVKTDLPLGMRRAVELIAREVRRDPSHEYVLLLGDSIAYSGPGAPTQSIPYYLEEWSRAEGRPWRVYNLGEPAMKAGDIYTLLLLLEEHDIPLRNVVIDLTYFQFSPHPPGESWVRWMGEDLKRLDPVAWREAHGQENPRRSLGEQIAETLLQRLALYRYRDLLRTRLLTAAHLQERQEVLDVRPWTEKPGLHELMKEPIYQRFVSPVPFRMDESNPAAVLFRRILAKTRASNLLVFFSPVNQALMKPWVDDPGYRANLARIDAFFAPEGNRYVNWESGFPSNLFVDHVHLTPEGYRLLAQMIGQRLSGQMGEPAARYRALGGWCRGQPTGTTAR
jgi:hypothetical protein